MHAYARLIAAVMLVTTAGALAPRPRRVPAPLAITPPMGWNSWNKFGCRIDEELIRGTADAMASSGMKDAGYQYVNIDDCWEAPQRDADGNLTADPQRFPHGIKALADYVHSKGLKIGIYSSAGTGTCQRRPASLDHEVADARTFAAWGIDYLKYDNCNNERRPALERSMLEVGNGHMTNSEYIAHFSLWSLLNAPLIAGNDLRSMSDSTRAILTNRDVIAVDQDWGGMQGHKIRDEGEVQLWAKPMSNGDRAVILLNRSSSTFNFSATTEEIGLSDGHHSARNLWTHADTTINGRIDARLAPHSVAMYIVRR